MYGQLGDSQEEPKASFWSRFAFIKKISWRSALVWGVAALAVLFVAGTGFVLWISKDLPNPNKLQERTVAESTKIYDRTGTHLLYEVYQDQKRTIVPLEDISPYVRKATVAIEDKNFYEHKGVRPISILRALFNNAIGRRAGSGGASTLTQQLIKITIVGDERHGFAGLFRKIKEAILAIRLERVYNKDQILQLYLNEIPYGSTNYGVEAAAQTYFHKSAKDVSIAEAATLAAIINRPSYYLNNRDALRTRRDVVLRLMQEQGYITMDEKKEAQNEAPRMYTGANLKDAPHFVLYVKQLLADQFGETAIDTGGLKIITTLDYDKQKAAEAIVKEQGDKFASSSDANNAALVAIDPHTGQILSMVGSRDYFNDDIDGQYNVAVLGKRQPGSSFKPFVYTLAFQKGYTPDTVVYDVKTEFNVNCEPSGEQAKDAHGVPCYHPKNYDGQEHGLLSFRESLQRSLNIPAVKALYLVSPTTTIEFAKGFGYTTFGDSNQYGLSLVLGGAEVNLLEHTNAYATLGDTGVYHAPVAILKVTDEKNNVLTEWKENEGTEAVSPEIAATITNVLTDDKARAATFGLGSNLTLPGRPVAAKTGTTNDNKDAWTLGYTPSLAAGVWVGNTTPKPMKSGGNALAGLIWNKFMRAALASSSVEQFPPAPGNDAQKPVLHGATGGIVLQVNKLNGRLATSSTPDTLVEKRTFLPPHDILFYVSRNDPRGPAPEHPENDSQYTNWETALQNYVNRQSAAGHPLTLSEPPTEQDVGSPEFAPTVQITEPMANATVASRQMNFAVNAASPRGVSRVTYFIDGSNVGSSPQFPFAVSYYAQKLTIGRHTLRAIAEDDQGNAGMTQLDFDLTAPYDGASINWMDTSPLLLHSDDFPRVMAITPFRWEDITHVKIYLKIGGTEKQIYDFNHAEDTLTNNQLTFTWKHSPGAGSYTLRAAMTDNTGKTDEEVLTVTVE